MKGALTILTFGLLVCGSARATNWWIIGTNNALGAQPGNNSNSGTSSNAAYLNFAPFNNGGASTLHPGDSLSIIGGFDGSTSQNNYIRFLQCSELATQINPIIVSNGYPGVKWAISNITTAPGIQIGSPGTCPQWLKVYGFVSSNNQYGLYLESLTNCEFAYFSCPTNQSRGILGYNNFQSNWFHNFVCSNVPGNGSDCTDGNSDAMQIGSGFVTAGDDFNIVEFFTNGYDGHAAIEIDGAHCVIEDGVMINPAWYYASWCSSFMNLDAATWWGGRECDVTFSNVLIQRVVFSTQGFVPDSPGELELESEQNAIVRNCQFDGAATSGINTYANESGGVCNSNYVYNNSFGGCGSNQTFYQNGTPVNCTYMEYQYPVFFFGTTNNVWLNNLIPLSMNYSAGAPNIANSFQVPFTTAVQDWRGNMTNSINPLWLNLANSVGTFLPNPIVRPDYHLTAGSPAIGVGVWVTTISSATGSGTSFTVSSNIGAFFPGITAANRIIPPDTIYLQGNGTPVQITTLTLNGTGGGTIALASSVSWTQGQWIAPTNIVNPTTLAIDAGAYAYSSTLAINITNGATLNLNGMHGATINLNLQ